MIEPVGCHDSECSSPTVASDVDESAATREKIRRFLRYVEAVESSKSREETQKKAPSPRQDSRGSPSSSGDDLRCVAEDVVEEVEEED